MFKSEVGGGGRRQHRLHVYRVQAMLHAAGTRAGTSLFISKNKHCPRMSAVFYYISYQGTKLNHVDLKKVRERFYLICLEKCSNLRSHQAHHRLHVYRVQAVLHPVHSVHPEPVNLFDGLPLRKFETIHKRFQNIKNLVDD